MKKLFNVIIWLFFGSALLLFRYKSIKAVWDYTHEGRFLREKDKIRTILLMSLLTVIVNVIVWGLVWWLIF